MIDRLYYKKKQKTTKGGKMSKLDQNKTPLFSVLKDEYAGRNMLPFHVPGHKRGKGVDKEFHELATEEQLAWVTGMMKLQSAIRLYT